MQFELWQLFGVGIGYLALLFLIATAAERGWLPAGIARHPITYTLSLGVYATSWSFYGSVGFAERQGYNFLTIYLGVTLAFVATPFLLQPLLRLTKEYQFSSLADLFAFRFHSQLGGVLVTLLMLVGSLPYIALQIRAVTDTLTILSPDARTGGTAVSFCIIIALFTILFGARHSSPREHHEGLVVAIAFESLVKLIALIAIGGFALFGVMGGMGGLDQWLQQHPEALVALYRPVHEGGWGMLLLLSFAAAFLLPRQFHMTFVENIDERSLGFASWAFPLFLLLLNLAIPPILWAGQSLQLNMTADLFVLGVGRESGSAALTLLTFVGGISAASAMIIVTTLALSSMCMNHLLLPSSFPPRLNGEVNLYRWLRWGRRTVIVLLIGLGFGFYLLLQGHQQLAGLGLISFVAVVQLLPGVVGVLFWKRATRIGLVAGLVAGGGIWGVTQILPLLERSGLLYPSLGGVPMSSTDSAFWSLLSNSVLFVVGSLLRRPTRDECEAAHTCSQSGQEPRRELPLAASISQFEEQLAKVTGREMAQHEVQRALVDLGLLHTALLPGDLGKVRHQISRNLSGLVGPILARMIVDERLQLDSTTSSALADTLRFVEQRLSRSQSRLQGIAGELDELRRFHRQVLHDLPLGVVSVSAHGQVVSWNQQMVQLTQVEEREVMGVALAQIPQPWSGLILTFLDSRDIQLRRVRFHLGGNTRLLNLHKATIEATTLAGEQLGTVILVEDQTELYTLESELAHSERLASIGRLATGVAHEIGNPVTAIACLTQEMREEPDDEQLRREGLDQILTQTQRISTIVHSLVSFSHVGAPLSAPRGLVSIHQLVDEATRLVSLSRGGKQHPLINRCAPEMRVIGDHQQLTQVVVNLLTNACDASPVGASIEVEAQVLASGLFEIRVIDHGCGIEERLREQVFEPFYTTKEPGKGTGLGLSLSYNIIQNHAGTIHLEDVMGGGCCVVLTLPALSEHDLPQ